MVTTMGYRYFPNKKQKDNTIKCIRNKHYCFSFFAYLI